jgi:hypothetical protein
MGTVHTGPNSADAKQAYRDYVRLSKALCGRAGGEPVTLFRDDEIGLEHIPQPDQPPKPRFREGQDVQTVVDTFFFSPGTLVTVMAVLENGYEISREDNGEEVGWDDVKAVVLGTDEDILLRAADIMEARGIHVTARKLRDMAAEITMEHLQREQEAEA